MIVFDTPEDWEAWLEENHASSPGVWLRIGKKGSGMTTVTHEQALDGALCHGWIDGQRKSLDDVSFLQKFTPRGKKSIWSKVNREKVQRLTDSGRMRPGGIRAVEAARADGRWDAAYDSVREATVPDDLQAALDASPAAKAFFATLTSQNRYAILFRTHTARKPETRAKRIREFIAMLERGETVYPQKKRDAI